MGKRKRVTDSDGESQSVPLTPATEGRPKRRRNDTTLLDTIQYIFDGMRNKKKEDDTYLCEAFLRIPRKKTEPQYYDVIKKPIDMLKIQQKLKTDIYNDLEEFCADVSLMVDNAKLYYAKSTDEYKDACELWDLFLLSKMKAPEEINKEKLRQQQLQDEEEKAVKRRGRPPKSASQMSAPMILVEDGEPMTVERALEELFGAIVTACDAEGRIYSYDFRLLPSTEKYPEYYEIITSPIDLKTIALRIQAKGYPDLDLLERDLILMFDNACQFNETGSRIYKDAKTLKRVAKLRKADLLHVLNSKKCVNLRSKRSSVGESWSALVSRLQEGLELPVAEEEAAVPEGAVLGLTGHDEDDSDDDVDPDNVQWQLMQATRAVTDASDKHYQLIEPFKRLPNRRWHSDYYQEIRNPISLSQIRKKIVRGEYRCLADLVADFNLMFGNARQYNRPDSRIHKDAAQLQKFVKSKAEELAPLEEEVMGDEEEEDDGEEEVYQKREKESTHWRRKREESTEYDNESDDSCQFTSGKKKTTVRMARPLTFKRRAKILFKTLMDYMTEDGRQPIVAFIEKPSRKDYPDYYEVITQPIDMETIEMKIKGDRYSSEDELIADFRVMFHNCKTYNEEGSFIYEDAVNLEKVLNEKIREFNLGTVGSEKIDKGWKKNRFQQFINASRNIKTVYSVVREYRDENGRSLAEVFLKLPPKNLYPDYYEVIRQPIDLERILHKFKSGSYSEMEDLMADLSLMFQNACHYNEPESLIYRDALTLHEQAMKKRTELVSTSEEGIPPVGALVQDLLLLLFIAMFNFQDDEVGRYYSESFAELNTGAEQTDVKKSRPLTFDLLKRRLDKGTYHRLDQFQSDLFHLFDHARAHTKKGSRLFKDSVILQKEYIKIRCPLGCETTSDSLYKIFMATRFFLDNYALISKKLLSTDELCNNGQTLQSPALSFSGDDLKSHLKEEFSFVSEEGIEEEEDDGGKEEEEEKPPAPAADDTNNSSLSHNQVDYHVGDFVYIASSDKGCNVEYSILHLERLWTNNEAKQMVYGCSYYRPSETFHVPTRKFLEQEVFKTDVHITYPLAELVGRCSVLPAPDYFRMKPVGFEERDIFVCESRYSTKNRFFKKIKHCPFTLSDHYTLVEREVPLEMKRVGSVFKERPDREKDELADDLNVKGVFGTLPNIARSGGCQVDGRTYYEQFNVSIGAVRLGDFVYVKGGSQVGERKALRRIAQIWVIADGNSFFSGTIFRDAMTSNPNESLFYKHEVYLSATTETHPTSDIIGHCSILDLQDFCSLRLTEVAEKDVFFCSSFIDELNQRVSGLQNGLQKVSLSPGVLVDEVYIFNKPVVLRLLCLDYPQFDIPSVKKIKEVEVPSGTPRMDVDYDDSMDGAPHSVTSADSGAILTTPKTGGKKIIALNKFQQVTGKKQITGYIMFSSEVRKSISQKNPNTSFGEISRLVGLEWKRLTESERKLYEDRSHQINMESAEKVLGYCPDATQVSVPSSDLPLPSNPEIVYECLWQNCDFMFEDVTDLCDHLLMEGVGHVPKVTQVFECAWKGCSRHKKSSLAPFPMIQRLARHMKEVHVIRNGGRIIPYHDRSRNFIASSRHSLLNPQGMPLSSVPVQAPISLQFPNLKGVTERVNIIPQKSLEPIFVAPPPKTHRLLHSETYIKYIENLEKPYVSNWERHLNATHENTLINDSGRLPAHWVPDGAASHGTLLNALWALRDAMVTDALAPPAKF